MGIFELAKLYRESADTLQQRLRELKAIYRKNMAFEEQSNLKQRIRTLEGMYRDVRLTADYLERYYEKSGR